MESYSYEANSDLSPHSTLEENVLPHFHPERLRDLLNLLKLYDFRYPFNAFSVF